MTRSLRLVDEALRVAMSQPVATAVTALIVAAVTGVIVSTTGQTVAIERDVLSRIDDAGTRTLVVEDTDGRAELGADAVDRVEALGGVRWAIGFAVAEDVVTPGLEGATAVPVRAYFGTLPEGIATNPVGSRPRHRWSAWTPSSPRLLNRGWSGPFGHETQRTRGSGLV